MPDRVHIPSLTRRSFLRSIGAAGLGFGLAERILAAPYDPLPDSAVPRTFVRVRGAVRSGGRGLPGVAISDGVSVVPTGADGTYELLTDFSHPFVFVSPPAGYEIPLGAHGSAALHRAVIPNAHGEVSAVWDLRRLPEQDHHHMVLLLADPQTLDQEDMDRFHATTIPDIRSTVAGLGQLPVFGVGCGDLMFDRLEYFPQYEKGIQATGVPFFQVLGNHDVDVLARTDEASTATFLRTFGPATYSFNRGGVHYVVMDDILWFGDGYIGYLHQSQLDWLAADLAFVERGRTVVVFMHIPPLTTQHIRTGAPKPDRAMSVVNRELLFRLLEPYRAHVVAGHMHEIEHLVESGVEIHVCGAVCGAWWTGPICADGTPNGYTIFDVTGEEVRWAYKSTGTPLAEQMRLYPAGTDSSAPDDVVVNIWDWNSRWNVVWYENGQRRGALRQIRDLDPLSRKLHSGPALPAKHTWVEPWPTDHLFRFTPAAGASDIMVEATDPWGRVYTGHAG
jgi:hypothetical protein